VNEKFELTKFSAGDTKEHEGVTYKAVRQEQDEMCKGVRSIREANLAKALEGGCA
jgi:hypothetical protein